MGKLTKEQKVLFDAIESPLRKETAIQYIANGYENSKQAYLKACKIMGRKHSKNPETSGSEILSYANVRAFIDSTFEIAAEKAQIDAEWVLNNLKEVAVRCMQAEPVMVKGEKGMEESGEYKFDSSGANKSLELIGKTMKMFTDKVEQDVSFTVVRKQYGVKNGN